VINAHEGSVYVVKYSFDGKFILSGGGDRKVVLSKAETGKIIKSYSDVANQEILDLTLS
jgi:WD40 repeat protein